jgi:hypothetical protein
VGYGGGKVRISERLDLWPSTISLNTGITLGALQIIQLTVVTIYQNLIDFAYQLRSDRYHKAKPKWVRVQIVQLKC